MNLNITPKDFENISEIYETGSQSVEVVTRNHRIIKITACKVLRGPRAEYVAAYEELVTKEINGQQVYVWIRAYYPYAHGKTIEDCIRYAMFFVNNQKF